jgi:hypothetical protein
VTSEQKGKGQSSLIAICLTPRAGNSRDIAACCVLLGLSRFVFDDATWVAVPDMWQALLSLGAMQLSLVESIGLSGFGGTELMERLRVQPEVSGCAARSLL